MRLRDIIDGPPGEAWTNDTPRVRYQFVASLHNTCGVCLQYHLKIGPWWPIPIHFGCRCRQVAVPVGARAPEPFADYRRLLAGMPHDQQVAAVGASNYRLLEAGLVKWDDIVTPSRVRPLREVVSLRKLSVKQMTEAGVRPRIAQEAYASVHTPAHELAEQHRRELAERLAKAGLSQDALSKELAARLAARLAIAPGQGWQGGRMPGAGGSQAADLARLLALTTVTRVAMKRDPLLKGEALIARAGETLTEMGIPFEVHTLAQMNATVMPGKFVDRRVPAVFDEKTGIVHLVVDNEYWTDPRKVMAKFKQHHWLSTQNQVHLAVHEGIHAQHLQSLAAETGSLESARERLRALHVAQIGGPGDTGLALRTRIQKTVGRYAAIDPSEFVAEVGAALHQGKTYPDWVMDLYRQYGGPPVTPRPTPRPRP